MNSLTNRRLGMAVAAIAIITASPALAVAPTDWDGATIGAEYLFPSQGSLYESDGTVVVGPGPEGTLTEILFSYDISGSQIILSNFSGDGSWNGATFNGPHFFDAGGDDLDLFGVTINPASNMAGLTDANLSWDADNIFVNWQGLGFTAETQVILDLNFDEVGSEVPEASTWAAGAALAAVVGGMWFRRRRA